MQFRDDGGTRAWRSTQATYTPDRKRMSLGQMIVLIVFFAYVLPFALIFGAPAIGALWDALVGTAHAETAPMKVKDYLADAPDLQGKVVSIQGSPGCMGTMCFMYEDFASMQTVMFDPAHLDRDTRRALLDCQPLVNACEVVLTGKAGGGPLGPTSIGATGLRWITRP